MLGHAGHNTHYWKTNAELSITGSPNVHVTLIKLFIEKEGRAEPAYLGSEHYYRPSCLNSHEGNQPA
jgi:hypothetical protein